MGATTSSPARDPQLQQSTSQQRDSAREFNNLKKKLEDSVGNVSRQSKEPPMRKTAPKSLLDVPNEILAQILHHIDDNAVIHHVQLLNKSLYLLATQRLYRHFNMTLVANSSMNYTYEQYLTNHIEGHDFIRDLEVSLKVEADVDPTPAYQWLSQLLEHLPQNNLTHFRSNFNRPLPPHLLRKL